MMSQCSGNSGGIIIHVHVFGCVQNYMKRKLNSQMGTRGGATHACPSPKQRAMDTNSMGSIHTCNYISGGRAYRATVSGM